MKTVYHVAPKAARRSITERGIDYRLGQRHVWWTGKVAPDGNYVFGQMRGAMAWLADHWDEDAIHSRIPKEAHDVWRVNAHGLLLVPDPEQFEQEDAWYLTAEPIGPERILLARTMHPHQFGLAVA